MNSRPAAAKIAAGVFLAAYPFAVLLALKSGSFGAVAAILALAAALGFFANRQKILLLCGLGVVCAACVLKSAAAVKMYPVVMNFAVMAMFALSLLKKPLVQIIGEKMLGGLPPRGVVYARKVTIAWAIFMLFLTACSAATVFMPDEVWAVFNGFAAYILIAIMFALEYIARKRFLKEDVC